MITVSEYVMQFLSAKGMRDIFLVSGGGIMYLLDAMARNKNLRYVCNYHEQACATAAESYARASGRPGVCLVTTGPGSTNAITGVAGAWYDSVPLFVIAGQVRTQIIANYDIYRQQAPQEVNIIPMVKPITKYATMILDPQTIRFELEKAYSLATKRRPGPVWITVPLDIQNSLIDESHLKGYQEKEKAILIDEKKFEDIIVLLKKAKRPLLVLGNGVRISTDRKFVEDFVQKLGIPTVLVLNGMDLIAEDNPFYIGRIGPAGQRYANFALQTCDLLFSIGASLNLNSTGFYTQKFAPRAKKIVVNVDPGELKKIPFPVDIKFDSDAGIFIQLMLKRVPLSENSVDPSWLPACLEWKKKYPSIIPSFYKNHEYVNSYIFFDELCKNIIDNATVVTGMGLDVVSFQQVFRVKKGQKAFVNKNFGQMGWCLPAAIGASIADKGRHVICVTGDGSLQFNIHELETISFYKLPITIFVFNNNGYKSIRDTQNNLFQGRIVGADPTSGVGNPDFKILAKGFGITYKYIKNNTSLKKSLTKILKHKGPLLCEVYINPQQERIPRPGTIINKEGKLESLPLEDLLPQIPRDELHSIMHYFDKKT